MVELSLKTATRFNLRSATTPLFTQRTRFALWAEQRKWRG